MCVSDPNKIRVGLDCVCKKDMFMAGTTCESVPWVRQCAHLALIWKHHAAVGLYQCLPMCVRCPVWARDDG